MTTDPNEHWFRRTRTDGRMEPHVSCGDNGEIAVMDEAWFVCFKDGRWHDRMLFSHLEMAEFTPVQDRDEVYRVFNEARAAFGLEPEHPPK